MAEPPAGRTRPKQGWRPAPIPGPVADRVQRHSVVQTATFPSSATLGLAEVASDVRTKQYNRNQERKVIALRDLQIMVTVRPARTFNPERPSQNA